MRKKPILRFFNVGDGDDRPVENLCQPCFSHRRAFGETLDHIVGFLSDDDVRPEWRTCDECGIAGDYAAS
jgi:hypothetical protein